MVKTYFSDANIFNSFSGGSLLPGHTVIQRVSYIASIAQIAKSTQLGHKRQAV